MSTRRVIIKGVACTAATLVMRDAAAQKRICPPDQIERVRVWNDYVMIEGQVNAGKSPISGGAAGKVPMQVIRWEVTCESIPKDPPPPKVPKTPPKSGIYLEWLYMFKDPTTDGDWIREGRSDLMYFNVGLPGFVDLWQPSASAKHEIQLANGLRLTHTAPLVMDGVGFRYADHAAVDRFLGAALPSAIGGTLAVDNVELGAKSAGSSNFWIGAHYAGYPLYGSTGLVYATEARPRNSTKVLEN